MGLQCWVGGTDLNLMLCSIGGWHLGCTNAREDSHAVIYAIDSGLVGFRTHFARAFPNVSRLTKSPTRALNRYAVRVAMPLPRLQLRCGNGIEIIPPPLPRNRSEPMTVDDVNASIEKIRQKADDYEAQHSMEDTLHQDVLKAIATGECDDPKALAEAALKTLEMDFMRYCA
jgi:hypothetical protein